MGLSPLSGQRVAPNRTSASTLGLLIVIWTLVSCVPLVRGTHPYSSGGFNCAFMNSCEVTDKLMQEINALKEKLVELVNFQVDVNQFKFEHGIHQSEMEDFKKHVENFIKSQSSKTQPAQSDNHDNDVADTSHADAPKFDTNNKDAMTLPAIHNRLEQVENTVRQWDENVLTSSTKNGETIRQTLEREEGTRKVLEEKIGHLQKKMDDVQTLLKEEKAKTEAMKNELWDLKQATNKHEAALGRHQDIMQTVNRTLRARVGDLEENMGYFSSNLFQLSYRGDEFMYNITRDVETVKKTSNSKFSNVTGHIDKLTSQVANLVSELHNNTKEMSFINGDVNEVKMQVETFVGRMFNFDILFTKHNRELQSVLKSIHETNSTAQRIWQTMGLVEDDVENLKSDVVNLEEALVAFNASVAATNQDIDTVWQICEGNLTDLRLLLQLMDRAVDDFRTSIAIDEKRLMSRHDNMEKRMDDVERTQKTMENEVEAYEMLAENHKSEMDYIKQQITANTWNVKEIKNNVKAIQDSLNSVRRYQTELKSNMTDIIELLLPLLPTTTITSVTESLATTVEYAMENATFYAETTDDSMEEVLAEPLTMLGEEAVPIVCPFAPLAHPNIVTSIRGRPIRGTGVIEVKEGEELVHHCKDIGAFQLEGHVSRVCLQNGSWTGREPTCRRLTTIEDLVAGAKFNESAPPAIQISPRPESSTTGVTPNGTLVVTPGSRVLFACIFPRRLGAATWSFTPFSGKSDYALAGHWIQETRNEVKLQHALSKDSGRYTCKNGKGGIHTINVVVKDVVCSVPPDRPPLHVLDPGKRRLNSQLQFTCKELGYVLAYPDGQNYTLPSGTDDVSGQPENNFRCLASGEWSRDFPTCVRKFVRGG